MKKFLTIALSALFVFGMAATGITLNANATAEGAPAAQAETATVYLVPGSYKDSNGETVYNTVAGATKLTDGECTAIHTPNAYLCETEAGEALPAPATTKTGVTFNGWWTIEDAEVVYHDTLPEVTQTLFLYADWRAELSQPKDPVNPPEETQEVLKDYLEITRKKTGKTEKVGLFVSATDVPNAVQAGYGGPVQFYNEWFYLSPGDTLKVYVSGVYGSQAAGPMIAPQLRNGKEDTQLEISGTSSTPGILKRDAEDKTCFNCIAGEEHPYRVYIKFYDAGGTMTIYMERQDKN